MADERTVERLLPPAAAERLDAAARAVQGAMRGALERPLGGRLIEALHGGWLGHPLHPPLTDLPIGSWCAAVALDTAAGGGGSPGLARAARLAAGLGTAGAVAAAAAGAADWSRAGLSGRRLGLAHGALNGVATLAFATSLVARGPAARRLRRAGLAVAGVAGYLGGSLVFREGLGVDHADRGGPGEWSDVAAAEDLPEGRLVAAEAEGTPVVLVRRGGEVLALGGACAHMGGTLAEGDLEGTVVTCPLHGSRFDMRDGSVCRGPSAFPQPTFETRERGGRVEVRAAG